MLTLDRKIFVTIQYHVDIKKLDSCTIMTMYIRLVSY